MKMKIEIDGNKVRYGEGESDFFIPETFSSYVEEAEAFLDGSGTLILRIKGHPLPNSKGTPYEDRYIYVDACGNYPFVRVNSGVTGGDCPDQP